MRKIETIAIVDDDDIYQYTAKRNIEASKLIKTVYVFSDGKEAIDFFLGHVDSPEKLPDVVFLDLAMPIMDGWQFLKNYVLIKPEIGKKITIYIVTSSMNPEDVTRAKSLSEVSDYIIKPITT